MLDLTMEVKKLLLKMGAETVGIGDISMIPSPDRKDMPYGISVLVCYEPEVIMEIEEGPTEAYYESYVRLNEKLDSIVTAGAEYLKSQGYQAIAQTQEEVAKVETMYTSILPHKTVATRAGIGWIGKNALLITEQFGSAVRISTIITNAPLTPDNPINESKCGACRKCTEGCPAGALKGENWNVHTQRDELLDPVKCRRKARELSKELINREISLCGKCVLVCPYTQKYLTESKNQK